MNFIGDTVAIRKESRRMKVSDFGTQIPVCPPKFDEINRTFSFNVGVQTAKAVDDAVITEIWL